MDQPVAGRRRRTYSAQFKAEAVAACRRPGVSLAAMAMERSVNANLLRRWVLEDARARGTAAPARPALPRPAAVTPRFVALPLQRDDAEAVPIRIELRRGELLVSVQWPSGAGAECAQWLREVLK